MKTVFNRLPYRALTPGKEVYFISDLHLGAPYSNDTVEKEKRVVRFLDLIKDKADTLFMLGDIIDYWFEYKSVVPKGYIRFFGKLAELADRGVRIVWIIGNHDIWLSDYFPSQFNIEIYDGVVIQKIGNRRFFLSHGDGLGDIPPMFAFIRSIFRNKVCQKLFSGIHPRWTIPFALAWSEHSRKKGMKNPDAESLPLLKSLIKYSEDFLSKNNERIDYFIFGHLHIFRSEELKGGATLVISGDWIGDDSNYIEYDGTSLSLRNFD